MTRRSFLTSTLAASAAAAAPPADPWPLGINTYCLRFQRWNDRKLIDWCIEQKLDAIFLQDSLDPGVMDPTHWAELRQWTQEAKLRVETGGGTILPKTADAYAANVATLRKNIERAKAVGSPIVRALLASDRRGMPPGPVEKHIETTVKVLREVRSQVMDAGIKIGIENHKELQAWETRQVIEMAGKEFVGSYLDTGNPVFVFEDPATTIEHLAPLAVTFHLRDSVVYEHPEGIAVQWVPLGEGTSDFRKLVARARELMPAGVHIYCKPITARPPVVLPVTTTGKDAREWWDLFPRARASELAQFIALAKRGRPYDKPMVVEDYPGRPEAYVEALKYQQLEHMTRSLDYCRKVLNLGVRWRG
ncbi:MAG: TIM barrel protein [Acidobacteria bacterium]|nr:TIM barrel protein [Acidobacteriota bacterium]